MVILLKRTSMIFAIIDNNQQDRTRFTSLIKCACNNVEIHTFSNVSSFLSSTSIYDFLFLDIQLDNEDGIQLSSTCFKNTKHIIYISTIKDRMQEAFSRNVVGFLLKQDDNQTLIQSIQKIIQTNSETYISLKLETGIQQFPVSSIYKITRENRKVFLYLKNTTIRIYDTNLKDIFEKTKDMMIWIDRSVLINYQHITSFIDDVITFDNQTKEVVNTRRKQKAFQSYLQKSFQNI